MIQYKYFHTGRGYIDRLSVDRSAQDYLYYETLFQKIRTMSEGNTFVYAALGSGNSLFMQSTYDAGSAFTHGMVADEMRDYPAKYINRFETEVEDPSSIEAQLPDENLPPIPNRKLSFPNDRVFHEVIPKIVDALICGDQNKQILIVTGNTDESALFMNAISAILPVRYMSRIGFAIGVKSFSNEAIRIPRNGTAPEDVSIRIWLPDLANYRFENFAHSYYVFDIKAGRDNYTPSNSAFFKALTDINLSDAYGVGDFLTGLNDAFSADGSVNLQLLETLSAIYLLGLHRDPETARRVIKSSNGQDSVQLRALVTAISVLLDPQNYSVVSAGDFSDIIKLCASNNKINEVTAKFVIHYIATSYQVYKRLEDADKRILIDMLASDNNTGMLCKLYDSWWEVSNAEEQKEVFSSALKISCDILDDKIGRYGDRAYDVRDVLSETISFFKKPIEDSVNELMDIAFAYQNDVTRKYAIAMIMAPSYTNGGNSSILGIQIECFKKKCSKMSAKDQLRLIIEIRTTMVQIYEEVQANASSLGWTNPHSFFISHNDGRTWCETLVGVIPGLKSPLSSNILEMLQMHSDLLRADFPFPELTRMVRTKLLDYGYVYEKIKSGRSLEFDKYDQFIKNEIQGVEIRSELNKWIEDRDQERKSVISSERFSEALTQFYTFSYDDRKNVMIRAELKDTCDLANLSADDKKRFVEEVSNVRKHTTRHNRKKFTFFADNIGILLAVVFPIISLVLLIIPALIQWIASPNIEFMARIQAYLPFIVILLPAFELVGLTACYIATNNASRKTKRTMIIGGLVNLPFVVFDIVYLVLYFTSIV